MGRDEAYPSRSANEQLSVGEGMISSESRMRETRMSGLMSGGRNHGYGVE